MARRQGVFGPYRHGKRWRLIIRRGPQAGGPDHGPSDSYEAFDTYQQALDVKAELARRLTAAARTVRQSLDEYEKHLVAKGNKASSITTTTFRLRGFFGVTPESNLVLDVPLAACTPVKASELYEQVKARAATDTHLNTLAEARTFFTWCVGRRWMRTNPLAAVHGVGKRRKHGKAQLRIDEARTWYDRARELAEPMPGIVGEPGAVAALMTVLMGLRAGEITARVVRDLDDEGRLLWIPDSKTEAGKRALEVPEELQPLLRQLAQGKQPGNQLLGVHDRGWPRKWVQRICDEVGVPVVSAHGMRGLHATLALRKVGRTARDVADQLGHEKERTTMDSYAEPGAGAAAGQEQVMRVLKGGKR